MTETRFEPSNVNVRMKISALWMSMLFVFALETEEVDVPA